MEQPAELGLIEFDREQVAAVLAYAAEHNMSPVDVVRHAVNTLIRRPRMVQDHAGPDLLGTGNVSELAARPEEIGATGSNLPAGFVSRHPNRDYSWVGSANGVFGDGVEYQKAVRQEW